MAEKEHKNDAQSVDGSDNEKKKNKAKKVLATTTYFIALLCLLAGLFAPLFHFDKSHLPESMMFRYLPSMFNGIFGKEIIPLGSYFLEFTYETGKFNFVALVGLLYAVVCVIALVMLVPILLGSKKKGSSARCALGVEVLAMLVTLTYIATVVYNIVQTGTLEWNNPDFNFLLAFGGSLLMAIIQTVSSKGSIGVSKVIGLVLSVIGVMAILDITMFIKELKDPLASLSETVKGGSSANFITLFEMPTLGIAGINMLIDFKGTINIFKLYAKAGKDGILLIVVYVLLMLVAVFTLVNLVSDVIGLSTGKKFKKDRSPCKNGPSNTFALVRYILPIVFAAAIIVISFVVKELELQTGVYLYLLVIVLFISLVNAAIRTAVDNARYRKGTVAPSNEVQQKMVLSDPTFTPQNLPVKETETADSIDEPYEEKAPAYAPLPVAEAEPEYVEPEYLPKLPVAEAAAEPEPDYDEPAYKPRLPVAETAAEPEDVEDEPVVVPLSAPLEEPAEPVPTVYIYGGATDEFMDSLTDNEKVEFVELFIKKSKGTVNGVPDYEIDGDNADFFPAVFVHINRYRNIVSDALMTKMYKQLGKQM